MNKLKTIFLSLIVTLFFACNSSTVNNYDNLKAENDSLRKELEICIKIIDDLKNTPQMRLNNAQKDLLENKYSDAKLKFQELIEKYPETQEAKTAKTKLQYIDNLIRKQKEEEERKKTLGYKVLNDNNKIKVGQVQLSFSTVSISGTWTFDSYDDEYRYRDAERGTKYIVTKISISADIKEPALPPILVYKMKNGELYYIGTMGYEFVRWEDYGSYLGNTADYGNDFAHTKTIRFTTGLQVSTEDLNDNAIFVVVKKINCFNRSYRRADNPPTSYIESNCGAKSKLTLSDFDKEYVVVKVFNRNKL